MEITEVKVFLVGEEKLKAFVSIVLDRCFMINDVKVIQGREGLFISMPSRRKKNGEFKDVAHPLNNDTRSWMEDRILREYEQQLYLRGNGRRVARPVGLASSDANADHLTDHTLDQVPAKHTDESTWSVGWSRTGTRSS